MAEAGAALVVRGLGIASGRGRVLLDVPALELPAGTSLGVRGPSGAGKSTFLMALAGLAPAARGSLRWGGDDILAMTEGARARFRRDRVGLVFQDFLLFDELDARENAGLGAMFAPRARRGALRARGAALLAELGVPDEPRGSASFSGGERQRIAVARALAHDPGIVLADEPTASLDRRTADALIDELTARTRARGATFVAVSHDARLLDRMDRVLTLDHGRIVPDRAAA